MSAMTRREFQAAAAASLLAGGAKAAVAPNAVGPSAAEQVVASGDLPGVVTVVWSKGRIVQQENVGVRNLETRAPMDRKTIFRLASMTKPVTVAAAPTLVDQGKIGMQDPITKWAPEFANMRVLRKADGPLDDTYPAPRVITIEDLMTHRSGLTYGFLAQGPLSPALLQKLGFGIESPLTPDQWIAALASLPLAYAPGERFNYGFSIDLLGFIVGRAAGSSLPQVMRERLFGPLGMPDTGFWVPPAKRDRLVVAYTPGPKGLVSADMPGFTAAAPAAYTSGGQGLSSTADDYLKFARMLLGGGQVDGVRVLKPETVRMMTTDHLTPEQRRIPTVVADWKTQGFGLGMSLITDPAAYAASGRGVGGAGTFSWGGAFGNWWQADPVNQVILIWLQQYLPAAPAPGTIPKLPPGIAANGAFQRQAYAALGL